MQRFVQQHTNGRFDILVIGGGITGAAVAYERLAQTLDGDGEILAQVTYAIRSEMARTLGDIVLRRTGIGTLGHPGTDVLEKVATLASSELGWDEDKKMNEMVIVSKQLMPPVPESAMN